MATGRLHNGQADCTTDRQIEWRGEEEGREAETERGKRRELIFLDFNVPSTAQGHLRKDRGE